MRDLPQLEAPRALSEDVIDVLRSRILDGTFRPGERLVEGKLARQMGISRGPVREALQVLRAEGLIADRGRHGTYVVEVTERDIREICQLRAAVEGRAAQLIARERRAEVIAALREILTQLDASAASDDERAALELDFSFHEALCRLSGNERLVRVFHSQAQLLRLLFRLDRKVFGPPSVTAPEHWPILNAIESGDPVQAQKSIDEHMRRAEDVLTSYVRRGVAT